VINGNKPIKKWAVLQKKLEKELSQGSLAEGEGSVLLTYC
jgi:hypothetical protein